MNPPPPPPPPPSSPPPIDPPPAQEPAVPVSAPLSAVCLSCGEPSPGRSSLCRRCQQTLRGFAAASAIGDEPVMVRGRVCLRCGYQLDGLRSDGECPECGAPVAASLQGDLLRFSAPEHLRTLHLGITIAEIALLMIVPMWAIGFVLHSLAGNTTITPGAVSFIGEGLGVLLTAASVAGWWMFSTPDPVQQGRDATVGPRRLLRVSLAVVMLAALVQFGMSFLVPISLLPAMGAIGAGAGGSNLLSMAFMVVGMAMFLIRFFTSLLYLQTIAVRIPNAELYKRAGGFMWFGPVITIVLCGLGAIIAYAMYIVMLDTTRRLLKHERARAAALHLPR